MRGGYNDEFVEVFREFGLCNPQYGHFSSIAGAPDDQSRIDFMADAGQIVLLNDEATATFPVFPPLKGNLLITMRRTASYAETWSVVTERTLTRELIDKFSIEEMGITGRVPYNSDKFNIIGYSFGAVVACLTAQYYAEQSREIDNLVLLGAPINPSLLRAMERYSMIKNIIIHDLTEFGDPIYAGMSDFEIIGSVSELRSTMNEDPQAPQVGHFYYSGSGTEDTIQRKRELVASWIERGLN